jgi:neutral amino acid transport system permease protein
MTNNGSHDPDPRDTTMMSDAEAVSRAEEATSSERADRRRKMIRLAVIGAALIAIMWVVATVSDGTAANICSAVLREMLKPQTAAVAIAVIGLNVHFGFTGLLNIGQAGYMLLGAYGFAISVDQGLPLGLAILVGIGASVLFSFFLGIPTLKLRGDYLAIVTICAAEILRYVGRLSQLTDVTGGSHGLSGNRYRGPFESLSIFGDGRTAIGPFDYSNNSVDSWWLRLVAWSLVALCVLAVWLLARSPWGRLLRGVREDEDAIRSLGKNVYAIKMQSLIIGGAFGALGGMIYVLPSTVQADNMGRSLTFFIWTALLLGGAATIFGPVLGTVIFFAARVLIREVTTDFVPDAVLNTQQAAAVSWMVVGIALMLLVIFRPQGILGNKKELQFHG